MRLLNKINKISLGLADNNIESGLTAKPKSGSNRCCLFCVLSIIIVEFGYTAEFKDKSIRVGPAASRI